MKAFKSPQRVTIVFLTLFIMLCCFLVIRLEIKAANLQSQWDEHQKSLKINEDQLYDLDQFRRNIRNGPQIQLLPEVIWLYIDGASLELKKNTMKGYSNGDISFGKGKSSYFGYNSSEKLTYMWAIGKGEKVQIKGDKLLIESSNGKNIISISDEVIEIDGSSKGSNFGISVGLNDQSVDIFTDQSLVRLKKDIIDIEADGDININSTNGNVNISGQKVKVNE